MTARDGKPRLRPDRGMRGHAHAATTAYAQMQFLDLARDGVAADAELLGRLDLAAARGVERLRITAASKRRASSSITSAEFSRSSRATSVRSPLSHIG
jgi:hypothetical protein